MLARKKMHVPYMQWLSARVHVVPCCQLVKKRVQMQVPSFPIHEDSLSGRRWRYRVPLARVLFSLSLFLAGFALCLTGLIQMAVAPGAAGLLCLVPGTWACFHYMRIWRGAVPPSPDTFLEIEELGEEGAAA